MASAFGHAALAATLGSFRKPSARSRKFWSWMIVFSIIPDADIIAFRLDIPYEHMLGHRGFTHSIFFAVMCGFLVCLFLFKEQRRSSIEWWKTFFALSFCMLSHGILDALTTGGKGVGFLIPFSSERFFFPVHPIKVSPISPSQFFSVRGLAILSSEAIWIGGACAVLIISRRIFKILRTRISSSS